MRSDAMDKLVANGRHDEAFDVRPMVGKRAWFPGGRIGSEKMRDGLAHGDALRSTVACPQWQQGSVTVQTLKNVAAVDRDAFSAERDAYFPSSITTKAWRWRATRHEEPSLPNSLPVPGPYQQGRTTRAASSGPCRQCRTTPAVVCLVWSRVWSE